jgi:8-oxo-dGTP diphosphatase
VEDTFHLGIKALIVNESGEILLLKVNPKALKRKTDPYWDLPGGRVLKGSSIEETLVREVEEEIGVSEVSDIKEVATVISNIRIPVDNGDVGLILSIYSCKIPKGSQIKISTEHTGYEWFPREKAAEFLKVKYPKQFTDKILSL